MVEDVVVAVWQVTSLRSELFVYNYVSNIY